MEGCDTPVTKSKASYDPGWNDPPSIAYNSQQTTPNRPRNFLNKRVAFPLSGGASNPTQTSACNLPPLPITTLTPPVHVPVSNNDENNTIDTDSKHTLEEVGDIFIKLLDNNSELGSKIDSIKKKISTMEEMWTHGNLSSKVQVQMKELACALRDDEPRKADDIHKALMINHVSEVSSWMPGVRQLIYHCLACSELLAIDKDE